MDKALNVVMVAGEYSGDILGAALIKALKEKYPQMTIQGIGGPKMKEEGCESWFPIEELMVMGIVEPLKRLPRLLSIRRQLRRRILKEKPDVFIGIDSPDFNLGLEIPLKKAGIPVVHYVSPTVWAWRKERIYTIKKAVDLMLILFPFEEEIYKRHAIPVQFVGHPLADQLPLIPNTLSAREKLNLSPSDMVLTVLPGSRHMVVKYLAQPFIEACRLCLRRFPQLKIVVAAANEKRKEQFNKILKNSDPSLPVQYTVGNSHDAMEAADVILLASGTATLEAMLLKKPMTVAYKLSMINYWIARKFIKIIYFSLPNLLANRFLIPEFFQDEANKDSLSEALIGHLSNLTRQEALRQQFTQMHLMLKKDASHVAANAIQKLIQTPR